MKNQTFSDNIRQNDGKTYQNFAMLCGTFWIVQEKVKKSLRYCEKNKLTFENREFVLKKSMKNRGLFKNDVCIFEKVLRK